VTAGKRANRFAKLEAWWQRSLARESVPNGMFNAKCGGTVEDHRNIALDVRELIRKQVFEQPVGTVFRPNLAFPWLRVMRLNSSTLDLELVSRRSLLCRLSGQIAAS
jgi:hypothetical protein